MDAQVKGTSIANANSERAKALQAALAQIEKQFGKGTIMRLGEGEVLEDIQVVSTGSLGLYTSECCAAGVRLMIPALFTTMSTFQTKLTL